MTSAPAAEYVVLEAALPGRGAEPIGILLIDAASDTCHLRFRRDLDSLDEEEGDILSEIPGDLESKSGEFGAARLLAWLENNASNLIRVSERESVLLDSYPAAADRLYRRYVSPKVLPFRTHLPQYSLRAAAGRFGENMEVEPEGWEEAPPDLRLSDDMFLAHVVGRSMEPNIPDGSLCVFRGIVTGSRQGKLVLVMNYGEPGENRFTIKRYKSTKKSDEGRWEHNKILLEPLNPEFEAWELTPDANIKVIGEFVRVLRGPFEDESGRR